MYKLMIVEDEEIIRNGLKNEFNWSALGFTVVGEAENGKDALELLLEISPDVILMDIRMPVMDGSEFMKKLRDINSDIKIVILSGYDDFNYAQRAIEYSACAYILKPTKEYQLKNVFIKIKNDLDTTLQNKSKIDDMTKKYEFSLPILKEKLFRDLIEGKITHFEDRQLQIIDLATPVKGYYGVLLLKVDLIDKADEIKNISIKNILLSIKDRVNIKETDSVEILEILSIRDTSIFALILFSTKQVNATEIINKCIKIQESIKMLITDITNNQIIISGGIGNFTNDLLQLSASYETSENALEYKFLKGTGRIIHINNCKENRNEINLNSFSYKSKENKDITQELQGSIIFKLTNSVVTCESDVVINMLEHIFKLINDNEIFEFKTVYKIILNIINTLSLCLSEKGIELGKITDRDIFNDIKNIISNNTLTDLKIWTIKFIMDVMEYIKNTQHDEKQFSIIEKIKVYLNENYNQKLSIIQLSKITFISASYLSTFFKKKTGYNLTDYLTKIRINKAKELLLKSEYKIYEIAISIGYDDYRYFSKIFKKTTGVNPEQYRKRQERCIEKTRQINNIFC